jgi:hypothetical protein
MLRRLAHVLPAVLGLLAIAPAVAPAAPAQQLRRYPYLTDATSGGVTVNWATDRSLTGGSVRWGKASGTSCSPTTSVTASRRSITVNTVPEYQWRARLATGDGTRFCYRVFGGATDLLGSDATPQADSALPSGSTAPLKFAVLGDWGQGYAAGNPEQAGVMRQIAASGARFAVSTGDIGYQSGSQTAYGDLFQTGDNISGVFAPDSWTIPGRSIPMFTTTGNHGFNATFLSMWPSTQTAAASGGRWTMETYCCTNGTSSASYPSAWYAFDEGDARFYVLEASWSDRNVGTATSYQNDYDNHWAPGTPQFQWLQADLANPANAGKLKFAFWHYPLYVDNPTEPSDPFLQGAYPRLEGLLNRYGVRLGFNGHAHVYQRNRATANGLVTYVTGGGGAKLEPVSRCSAIDAYAIGWSYSSNKGSRCGSATAPTSKAQVFHFLLVDVDGTRVTVTPTDSTGRTFDVQTYDFSGGSLQAPATRPQAAPALARAAASGGTARRAPPWGARSG